MRERCGLGLLRLPARLWILRLAMDILINEDRVDTTGLLT